LKYYADTSFILSLYIQQDNSKIAVGFLLHHKISLLFTSLNRHELRNAVRLCVFRRQITGKEAVSVLTLLEEDLKAGVFLSANVPWSLAFNIAEELSEKHTESMGIRGMDILHVAVARSLDVAEFLTFDIRQKALAEKAGLKVRP
jgi:predicted nucleic acid-binding protein